jgi:hypothetical protein
VGKLVGKKLLGVPRGRRTNNIKLDLKEIVLGPGLDYLARDKDQ